MLEATESKQKFLVLGRLGKAFGVKGDLRVISLTSAPAGIADYDDWYVFRNNVWGILPITAKKLHHTNLIVHIEGVDDRDLARQFTGMNIAICEDELQPLEAGEYYWRDLQGMQVVTTVDPCILGEITRMLETGSHDVMVVKPTPDSIDDRERLIPWVEDHVVLSVDKKSRCVQVEWKPDY